MNNRNNAARTQTPGSKAASQKKRGLAQTLFFGKPKEKFEVVRYREGIDRLFLVVVIILLSLGTVMVFSASYAYAQQYMGDSYHFAKKQLQMAGIGLVVMALTSHFAEYNLLRKLSPLFFMGVLILNYLTPFIAKAMGWGANGAYRWLKLGTQFQPSELYKLAVVMFFAYYIVNVGDKMRTFRYGILIPFFIIGIISGSMILQRHFSGLIIIAIVGLIVIFIGEAPIAWLAGFGGAGAAAVGVLIFFTDYASARIAVWRDPTIDPQGDGYQTIQSLLAIGSGGLFGVGIGESRQKYLYLPEPQNDFIFSIICEELGFIGAILIILLFVVLIWRGFVIAFHAPDKYSAIVVIGITCKVALQTILNIAVVTNTIPNTGISLPFFSYGGTALIILLMEMGIILSISRYSLQEK